MSDSSVKGEIAVKQSSSKSLIGKYKIALNHTPATIPLLLQEGWQTVLSRWGIKSHIPTQPEKGGHEIRRFTDSWWRPYPDTLRQGHILRSDSGICGMKWHVGNGLLWHFLRVIQGQVLWLHFERKKVEKKKCSRNKDVLVTSLLVELNWYGGGIFIIAHSVEKKKGTITSEPTNRYHEKTKAV